MENDTGIGAAISRLQGIIDAHESMDIVRKTKIAELTIALDESLKLQKNYAIHLNVFDEGNRIVFNDSKEWIDRLRKIGKLSAKIEIECPTRKLLEAFWELLNSAASQADDTLWFDGDTTVHEALCNLADVYDPVVAEEFRKLLEQ